MRSKQSLVALALIVVGAASIALLACQQPPSAPTPTTNVNQSQQVIVTVGNQPGGVGASPAPGTCNPIGTLGLNVPTELKVGTNTRLDATPKDLGGQIRSDACNIASGIRWNASPIAVCSLNNDSTFTPFLKGESVGVCSVAAVVGVTGQSQDELRRAAEQMAEARLEAYLRGAPQEEVARIQAHLADVHALSVGASAIVQVVP